MKTMKSSIALVATVMLCSSSAVLSNAVQVSSQGSHKGEQKTNSSLKSSVKVAERQVASVRRTDIGAVLCRCLNGSLRVDDPATKFERAILKEIGVDVNHPNKEKIISEFFNKNNEKLNCGKETTNGWREREHILKRSISANMYHFLQKVGSSRKYSIDFNYYEMVDGKKETILDYLDKILADDDLMEGYDRDELEELVGMIEDVGGKRGDEL